MDKRLLFVCSGNITRSPTAAVLADLVALELSMEPEIASAGTLGIEGQPAHPQMVSLARQRGMDLSGHRSQGLTADLCRWATHIVVMAEKHAEAVEMADLASASKLTSLGPLIGAPRIEDPTGSMFTAPYRDTFEELERAVRRFMMDLKLTDAR